MKVKSIIATLSASISAVLFSASALAVNSVSIDEDKTLKTMIYMGGENAQWQTHVQQHKSGRLMLSQIDADVGYPPEIDNQFKQADNPFGSAQKIQWTGSGKASFALVNNAPLFGDDRDKVKAHHKRYRDNGYLVFNMKIAQGDAGDIRIGSTCRVSNELRNCLARYQIDDSLFADNGLWQTYRIRMTDIPGYIPPNGLRGSQHAAFVLESRGHSELELHIANVRWEAYPKQQNYVDSLTEDLLREMTLDEKTAQMAQVTHNVPALQAGEPGFPEAVSPQVLNDDLTTFPVGSMFGDSMLAPHDSEGNFVADTPASWFALLNGYQLSMMTNTDKAIPILFGVDAVHGLSLIPGATVFPHNIGLGASGNTELARDIARATALEASALGLRMNFAPTLAVARDERWGRTYESFAETPEVVAAFGLAMTVGYQGSDQANDFTALSRPDTILATAKHFGGDGGTEFVDPGSWCTSLGPNCGNKFSIDRLDIQLNEMDLFDIHLRPYVDVIEAGTSVIMMSDSFWQGQAVTGSTYVITDLLKGQMGYNGIVLTDYQAWMNIGPVDPVVAMRDAIIAGNDMIMLPRPSQYAILQAAVERGLAEGSISPARIDDAVRRILRQKFALGLFDVPLAQAPLLERIGSPEHKMLARQAVQESLVLLKNDPANNPSTNPTSNTEKPVLPLSKSLNLYIAGKSSNDIGIQSGGWTDRWQGVLGNDLPGTSVLTGFLEQAEGQVVHSSDASADMSGADVGIVVVGEYPYSEFCGDVLGKTFFCEFQRVAPAGLVRGIPQIPLPFGLPQPQTLGLGTSSFDYFSPLIGEQPLPVMIDPVSDQQVIERVCSAMPCIVVLVSGRPMFIEPALAQADAFVAAWLPGTEGAGIADVFYAENGLNFSGTLKHTWPQTPRDAANPEAYSATPELDYVPQNEFVNGNGNLDHVLFPVGYGLRH
ncbi:MAG: hypothetical protein COA42_15455 [Alteromonadaceae bacterium]|nr:MAG: hypothetical protein COA42_15455 [Alteromonadaceae bacterium]